MKKNTAETLGYWIAFLSLVGIVLSIAGIFLSPEDGIISKVFVLLFTGFLFGGIGAVPFLMWPEDLAEERAKEAIGAIIVSLSLMGLIISIALDSKLLAIVSGAGFWGFFWYFEYWNEKEGP